MDRGGVTYYYHYDGLGSVTEITDSSGSLIENYTYDPYGNATVFDQTGTVIPAEAGIQNPYMFTGRRFDSESGIYYYRARQYDPTIGRFLQRDPIGLAGGLNLYAYVENNPINMFDPFGLRGTFSENYQFAINANKRVLNYTILKVVKPVKLGINALVIGSVAKSIGGSTPIQAAQEFLRSNARFAPGLGFSGLAGAAYAFGPVATTIAARTLFLGI